MTSGSRLYLAVASNKAIAIVPLEFDTRVWAYSARHPVRATVGIDVATMILEDSMVVVKIKRGLAVWSTQRFNALETDGVLLWSCLTTESMIEGIFGRARKSYWWRRSRGP